MESSNLPSAPRTAAPSAMRPASGGGSTLADVLERVLDKGVVIVGDVGVNVLDIELLTLKVRLLIASADTARSMGIDWWTSDPFLSADARKHTDEVAELRRRVAELEGEAGRGEAAAGSGSLDRGVERGRHDR
jgi:hypothetical protein